jgi:hypothetical protein
LWGIIVGREGRMRSRIARSRVPLSGPIPRNLTGYHSHPSNHNPVFSTHSGAQKRPQTKKSARSRCFTVTTGPLLKNARNLSRLMRNRCKLCYCVLSQRDGVFALVVVVEACWGGGWVWSLNHGKSLCRRLGLAANLAPQT